MPSRYPVTFDVATTHTYHVGFSASLCHNNNGPHVLADSNVFMDKVHQSAQVARDSILADPDVVLSMPKAVRNEIMSNATQDARMANAQAHLQLRNSAPVPSNANVGKKFNLNDAKLVATAEATGLPIITANKKMQSQVEARRSAFPTARVLVLGEDVKDVAELRSKCQ